MLGNGASLGLAGLMDHASIIGMPWVAAITVSTSAGFRKAGMFKSNEETLFPTWSLVSWYIGGFVQQPTDEQLSGLTEGDYLVLTPPPSKLGQFNAAWGSHPIYLAFHNQQRNAARAVRDLAIAVGPQHRHQPGAAVFVGNNKAPLTTAMMISALMISALHAAVTSLVGSVRAKVFTWHSGRVFLCIAFHAANVKPAVIQAMVRW